MCGCPCMKYPLKVLAILAPIVLILDQWTKGLVVKHISFGETLTVIPGYFDWIHVRNPGAAFGLLSQSASWFRVPFFYVISVIAIGVLVYTYLKIKDSERYL